MQGAFVLNNLLKVDVGDYIAEIDPARCIQKHTWKFLQKIKLFIKLRIYIVTSSSINI